MAAHVPEFNFFVSATSDDDRSEGGGGRGVSNDCICDSIVGLFDTRDEREKLFRLRPGKHAETSVPRHADNAVIAAHKSYARYSQSVALKRLHFSPGVRVPHPQHSHSCSLGPAATYKPKYSNRRLRDHTCIH